jgi:hypothetical protein
MDTARIEKRIGVRATPDRIWDLIGDLTAWRRWNPVETDLQGAIAFGGEVRATETIDGLPPRPVSARIGEWQPRAQLVWVEQRGLWFRTIRYFEIDHLEEAEAACIVANGFIFKGLRGEMFFDKHRHKLRRAVDAVGEALKAAAEA